MLCNCLSDCLCRPILWQSFVTCGIMSQPMFGRPMFRQSNRCSANASAIACAGRCFGHRLCSVRCLHSHCHARHVKAGLNRADARENPCFSIPACLNIDFIMAADALVDRCFGNRTHVVYLPQRMPVQADASAIVRNLWDKVSADV